MWLYDLKIQPAIDYGYYILQIINISEIRPLILE